MCLQPGVYVPFKCVFSPVAALIPLLQKLEPSVRDRVQNVAGQLEIEVQATSNMQPVQVSAMAAPIASESLLPLFGDHFPKLSPASPPFLLQSCVIMQAGPSWALNMHSDMGWDCLGHCQRLETTPWWVPCVNSSSGHPCPLRCCVCQSELPLCPGTRHSPCLRQPFLRGEL